MLYVAFALLAVFFLLLALGVADQAIKIQRLQNQVASLTTDVLELHFQSWPRPGARKAQALKRADPSDDEPVAA